MPDRYKQITDYLADNEGYVNVVPLREAVGISGTQLSHALSNLEKLGMVDRGPIRGWWRLRKAARSQIRRTREHTHLRPD